MWRLTIKLFTCNDFKHCSTFVSDSEPEVEYEFNSRKQAIKILKEFYDELYNTITEKTASNRECVTTIKDFKKYLYKLLDHVETTDIAFAIGDPIFEIKLIEIECEETHTVKGTYVKKIYKHFPDTQMSILPNFKDNLHRFMLM